MKQLFDAYTSTRIHPVNLCSHDLALFAHEFSKPINETTIEIVENVDVLQDTIFNRHSFKFYSKHTYVEDSHLKLIIPKLLLYFGPYEVITKGIWIKDNWSWGYFHWITDALTRLIASEDYMDSHLVILPKEFEKIHYITQSLEMLNYKAKYYNLSKRLHVKELLLPSHTAPVGNYNKEVINKVRERFFDIGNTDATPLKRIFISRQKARFRKISNENELMIVLESFGFEIHFFEDYPFTKQVNLMKKTSHLIGMHGAGLTNMLFMPLNGKVLELRNKDDAHNNCFFTLASDLGHDYFYLLNEGDSSDTHFVNITVDIEKLKKALEHMMA
jgi:capsular polysaccharide biosynthesis protein